MLVYRSAEAETDVARTHCSGALRVSMQRVHIDVCIDDIDGLYLAIYLATSCVVSPTHSHTGQCARYAASLSGAARRS